VLNLTNGHLNVFSQGTDLAKVLDDLDSALAARGIAHGFDPETLPLDPEAARTKLVWATLSLSLDRLPERNRTFAMELAVFAGGARVTLEAVARLWGIEIWEADRLVRTLRRLALVRNFDGATMALHDAIRQVLGEELGAPRLLVLHRRLIDNWRAAFAADWRELTDDYALRHLLWHMTEDRDAADVEALLLDPTWMIAKLAGPGVECLLKDYPVARLRASASSSVLVGRSLRLAAGPLAANSAELSGQLLGRLGSLRDLGIARLLDRAAQTAAIGSLLPTRPTLTAPGPELIRFEGHSNTVKSIAILPDGRVASAGADGTIRVWDLTSGTEKARLNCAGRVGCVTALPDGHLVWGSGNGTIHIWDLASGTELAPLRGHEGWVSSLAALSDGRLVSGGGDSTIRVWDLTLGLEVARLVRRGLGWVTSILVMPDGRVVSGGEDGAIRIFDLTCGTAPVRLGGGGMNNVYSLAMLPDGRVVAGGIGPPGGVGMVRIWDLERRAKSAELVGHDGWVHGVAVLPDGRIVSGDSDGTILVWDLLREAQPIQLTGHTNGVNCIAALPDGLIVSGGDDYTIRVWDLQQGTEPTPGERQRSPVESIATLPNGFVVSGSRDGTVRIFDPVRGARLSGSRVMMTW